MLDQFESSREWADDGEYDTNKQEKGHKHNLEDKDEVISSPKKATMRMTERCRVWKEITLTIVDDDKYYIPEANPEYIVCLVFDLRI